MLSPAAFPRRASSAVLLLLVAAAPVAAQDPVALRRAAIGERVRLTLGHPPGTRVVGVLTQHARDSMTVRVHADSVVRLAVADVLVVEGSEGRTDSSREMSKGAIWGAAGGVALTLLLGGWRGVIGGSSEDRAVTMLLASFLGGIGAGLGAIAGASTAIGFEGEVWITRETPVPGQDTTPMAAGPGVVASPRETWRALARGMRVRVRFTSTRPDLIGHVVQHGDVLEIRNEEGRTARVAWSAIHDVERSLGRPSFLRRSLVPVVAGAAVGWYVMPRVERAAGATCDIALGCTDGRTATATGAVLGAGVGLIIGETRREERWESLRVPPSS